MDSFDNLEEDVVGIFSGAPTLLVVSNSENFLFVPQCIVQDYLFISSS